MASLVVGALWGLGGAALAWSSVLAARQRNVRSRVSRLGIRAPEALRPAVAPDPPYAVRLLGKQALTRWPTFFARVPAAIERSGLPGQVSAADVAGWQAIGLTVGLCSGLWAAASGLLVALLLLVVGPLLGWFGPLFWLRTRAQARRRLILHALPTAIDLLALCLEAGMGLDRSLRTIAEGQPSPLSDEIRRVLADIDLGSSRRDAFGGLASRAQSDELRSLMAALVQSEELGTSLLPTIQAQARQVRLGRRRSAEKAALQAPVKMTVPMVLFILPALFLVVLGPAAVQLSQQSFGK